MRLLAILALLLVGCSSSSDVTTVDPLSPTSHRAGTAVLDRRLSRVPVAVDGGTPVISSRSTFFVSGVRPGSQLQVQVPGGPLLSLTVGDQSWLWVSPVTTFVSRYLQTHPGVDLETASERVRRYLQIPVGVDLGSGLRPAFFSWPTFVKAAGSTPIDQFIDQQVAQVDGGSTVSFAAPERWPALQSLLGKPDPDLSAVRARSFGDLFTSVADNTVADLATDGITSLVGWVAGALGFNDATEQQLNAIENQLNQVLAELNQLSTDLQNDFQVLSNEVAESTTADQITTIQTSLGPVTTRIQSNCQLYLQMLQQAQPTGALGTPILAPPPSAAKFVDSLTSYANATTGSLGADLSSLRQSLRGLNNQPNLPMLYSTLMQQALGNSSPSGANLFCDLRANSILQQEQEYLDFYRAHQVLGLLLTVEASHVDPQTYALGTLTSNLLAANIEEATRTLRQMSQDLVVEGQQVPPATLASDEVIVDMANQVMYYNELQYAEWVFQYGNPDTIPSFTGAFSLGPWGAGQWLVPTVAQITALRNYALAAGNGNVVNGLERIGFSLPGQSPSETLVFFVLPEESATSFPVLYNMNNGTTSPVGSDSGGNYYNFLLARSCPGGTGAVSGQTSEGEDPGTLMAVANPSSFVTTSPLGALGQFVYSFLVEGVAFDSIGFFQVQQTSNLDYTARLNWTSSNTSALDVSNLPGNPTTVIYHTASPGSTQVIGSLLSGFTGTAGGPPVPSFLNVTTNQLPGTPSNPVLQSILVVPNNSIIDTVSGVPPSASVFCFATGFYSDGSVKDVTNQVTWSVVTNPVPGQAPPRGTAAFDPVQLNLLRLQQSLGVSLLTVTATVSGVTGTSQLETDFFN